MYFLCLMWVFARVTAGVHYPFDILGGRAFGATTTLFVYFLPIYVEPWVTLLIRAFRRVYLA
jgi:membrane-associated phospholipid phosphatase